MSASSIGSSLDIATLVGAMMKPHEAKVASYSKKISNYNVQISDLSKIKDSFSKLQTSIKNVEKNQTSDLSTADLKSALQSFVDNYNSAKTIAKNSTDYAVKSAFSSLRRDLDPVVASKIGISFDRTGMAIFDASKVEKIAADEANGIFPTLTTTTVTPIGQSGQTQSTTTTATVTLDSLVNGFFDNTLASTSSFSKVNDYNGAISKKLTSIENQVDKLEREREDQTNKLSYYESMYTKQFTNLQNMLDKLATVESSMTGYTNMLNKSNN